MVRTFMCDAAPPGEVRATTARFSTLVGGCETPARKLEAPKALWRVGEKLTRLDT